MFNYYLVFDSSAANGREGNADSTLDLSQTVRPGKMHQTQKTTTTTANHHQQNFKNNRNDKHK